jgi:hypothetical protein
MQVSSTYQIILFDDLTLPVIDEVNQNNKDTVRRSQDGTKCIVSWQGATPYVLSSGQNYTHEQILAIINDEQGEWYVAPPDVPNP